MRAAANLINVILSPSLVLHRLALESEPLQYGGLVDALHKLATAARYAPQLFIEPPIRSRALKNDVFDFKVRRDSENSKMAALSLSDKASYLTSSVSD